MPDELADLIDTAIYKEIVSQAFYVAGQLKTDDPAARALMAELAEEEEKHARWLRLLKERVISVADWHPGAIADLAISEYLTGGDSLDDAGFQDALLFAIKREQQSVAFYSRLTAALTDPAARDLGVKLEQSELGHKRKLEILYDDMLAAAGN